MLNKYNIKILLQVCNGDKKTEQDVHVTWSYDPLKEAILHNDYFIYYTFENVLLRISLYFLYISALNSGLYNVFLQLCFSAFT